MPAWASSAWGDGSGGASGEAQLTKRSGELLSSKQWVVGSSPTGETLPEDSGKEW